MTRKITATMIATMFGASFSLIGCAQSDMGSVLRHNDKIEPRMADGQTSATVPFEMVNGHMLVPVSINDEESLSLLFDTGATPTSLFSTSKIDKLDLQTAAQASASGLGDGPRQSTPIAEGVTFKLGSLEFRNLRTPILSTDALVGEGVAFWIDAIMGYDLYSRFAITVDPEAETITFTEPDAFIAPQGASRLPLTERGRDLYIEIDVTPRTGEVPVKAELHVDTGSGSDLWLLTGKNEPFQIPENGERILGVRGVQGAVSGANAPVAGRVPTVRLGSESVFDVPALFSGKGSLDPYIGRNGRIGTGLLNRFRYTFNLAEGALYLEPLSIDQPSDEWRYGFGAAPMQDGTYRVVRVTKDGAADDIGIHEGDILVSFGGNELVGIAYKDALDFLLPLELKTVTACYRRDEETTCVEITSRKTL